MDKQSEQALNALAQQLILRDDLSVQIPDDYADEIAALTVAGFKLADYPLQFRAVTETLFNLGFVAGREDAKLDVWRDE